MCRLKKACFCWSLPVGCAALGISFLVLHSLSLTVILLMMLRQLEEGGGLSTTAVLVLTLVVLVMVVGMVINSMLICGVATRSPACVGPAVAWYVVAAAACVGVVVWTFLEHCPKTYHCIHAVIFFLAFAALLLYGALLVWSYLRERKQN